MGSLWAPLLRAKVAQEIAETASRAHSAKRSSVQVSSVALNQTLRDRPISSARCKKADQNLRAERQRTVALPYFYSAAAIVAWRAINCQPALLFAQMSVNGRITCLPAPGPLTGIIVSYPITIVTSGFSPTKVMCLW